MMNALAHRCAVACSLLLLACTVPGSAGVPEGFETYEGLKEQFVLSLPVGWSVYNQVEALTGSPGETGTVAFSAETLDSKAIPEAMKSGDQERINKLMEQLARLEIGEAQGFFLERLTAKKGMSCSGFETKAEKKVLKLMGTDPMFGPDRTTHQEPQGEPVTIGGCQGLRFKGKGETRSGDPKIFDVFAFSDGKVLYLFQLLNIEEHYAVNVGIFEEVLSTLELAVSGGSEG